MRARIRRLNYSIRTEDACVDWGRQFVLSMSGNTARFKRDRDRSSPDASRDSRQCVGFDPGPGEERAAISLSAGA